MKKKFWNSDKILSLSALCISLFTLMVFVYQTNLIRKQQFMSVYPHLALTNTNSGSLEYQYVLKNDGIGPAFIKSITIEDLSGANYNSINEYLVTKLSANDSIWIYNSDIFEGQLIPANESMALFGLFDEEQTSARGLPKNSIYGAKKLRQILNNEEVTITIVYESIYGEKWSINNKSETPIKK